MSSSACQQINLLALHPPFCSPCFYALLSSSLSFLDDVILVLPLILSLFPFPSPSVSSVYPLWRGPVLSAPTPDKPSLSLSLFYRTRGSRKGSPALCSAVQQTGASQAGRSVAQRGSSLAVSLDPRGMRGC